MKHYPFIHTGIEFKSETPLAQATGNANVDPEVSNRKINAITDAELHHELIPMGSQLRYDSYRV